VSCRKYSVRVRKGSGTELTWEQIPWYCDEEFDDLRLCDTPAERTTSAIAMDAVITVAASDSPSTVGEASLMMLEEIRALRQAVGVSIAPKLFRFCSDCF
jgi:hypothetical protein